MVERLPPYIHITEKLLHESALASAREYTGLSYHETGFGAVGGGTIPAVWNEALNAQQIAHTILDTPNPIDGYIHKGAAFPFETLLYDVPRYPNKKVMTWADMIPAYENDLVWMDRHTEQQSQPGRHLSFLHHTVSVAMEASLRAQLLNNADRVVAMRYHSQLLPTTALLTPDYFAATYGSISPNDKRYNPETAYLWNIQQEAVQHGDVHFISTDPERVATIQAVSDVGWLTSGEAEDRFVTIPIPIDTEKFKPDPSGNQRAEQIRNLNLLSEFNLDPNKRYIGTVSRRDHEKNIWDLVKAYGQFARNMRESELTELPDLLIIGGPTNKTGVAEKEKSMQEFLHELPLYIRSKIHISHSPRPHEDVVHIFDMEIYPSWEESFNISAKEASAAGKAVALSTQASGHRGTNTQDTAIWFTPLPLDDSLGNYVSYQHVFQSAIHLQRAFQPGSTQLSRESRKILDIAREGYNYVMQNFSSGRILEQTLRILDAKFPGFFTPDEYNGVYPGIQIPA